jgi:hypothetical protein
MQTVYIPTAKNETCMRLTTSKVTKTCMEELFCNERRQYQSVIFVIHKIWCCIVIEGKLLIFDFFLKCLDVSGYILNFLPGARQGRTWSRNYKSPSSPPPSPSPSPTRFRILTNLLTIF